MASFWYWKKKYSFQPLSFSFFFSSLIPSRSYTTSHRITLTFVIQLPLERKKRVQKLAMELASRFIFFPLSPHAAIIDRVTTASNYLPQTFNTILASSRYNFSSPSTHPVQRRTKKKKKKKNSNDNQPIFLFHTRFIFVRSARNSEVRPVRRTIFT